MVADAFTKYLPTAVWKRHMHYVLGRPVEALDVRTLVYNRAGYGAALLNKAGGVRRLMECACVLVRSRPPPEVLVREEGQVPWRAGQADACCASDTPGV